MKTDKERRAMMRRMRRALHLTQNELANLAGVSVKLVARMERGKNVSRLVHDRVNEAIFRIAAKRNPDAVNRGIQPVLKALETYEKILALESGGPLAIELERLNGKSLSEMKAQAEGMSHLLGTMVENARLLIQ